MKSLKYARGGGRRQAIYIRKIVGDLAKFETFEVHEFKDMTLL
jgi:hypothetical protein